MGDTKSGRCAQAGEPVGSDDYRQRRRDLDERSLQYRLPPDVAVEPVTANGVRAEWTATPASTADTALLYLHGGGYVIGSLDSHRHLVAEAGPSDERGGAGARLPARPRAPVPGGGRGPLAATGSCWRAA